MNEPKWDEWRTAPYPEHDGRGVRVRVKGGDPRTSGTAYYAWNPGEEDSCVEWRWLQKPGELEALRERVRDLESALSQPARDVDGEVAFAVRPFQRIVGEVQQALAGKPAEECVTDEGRAVAWLRHAVIESDEAASASSFREARDVSHATLANTRALCAENGWTP